MGSYIRNKKKYNHRRHTAQISHFAFIFYTGYGNHLGSNQIQPVSIGRQKKKNKCAIVTVAHSSDCPKLKIRACYQRSNQQNWSYIPSVLNQNVDVIRTMRAVLVAGKLIMHMFTAFYQGCRFTGRLELSTAIECILQSHTFICDHIVIRTE